MFNKVLFENIDRPRDNNLLRALGLEKPNGDLKFSSEEFNQRVLTIKKSFPYQNKVRTAVKTRPLMFDLKRVGYTRAEHNVIVRSVYKYIYPTAINAITTAIGQLTVPGYQHVSIEIYNRMGIPTSLPASEYLWYMKRRNKDDLFLYSRSPNLEYRGDTKINGGTYQYQYLKYRNLFRLTTTNSNDFKLPWNGYSQTFKHYKEWREQYMKMYCNHLGVRRFVPRQSYSLAHKRADRMVSHAIKIVFSR